MDLDDYDDHDPYLGDPTSARLTRLERLAEWCRERGWRPLGTRWQDRCARAVAGAIRDEQRDLAEAAWEASEARRGRHYSGLRFSGPI